MTSNGNPGLLLLLILPLLLTPTAQYPPTTAIPAGTYPVVTVNITDYKFTSRILNITTGTTVTWINRSPTEHTVTENSTPPLFNSGSLSQNQSYSFQFLNPGLYHYYCAYHLSLDMTGTINATGPAIGTSGTIVPPFSLLESALVIIIVLVLALLAYRRHRRTPEVTSTQEQARNS